MSEPIVLRGPQGIGPIVEGEALVSRHGFSARYDVDRDRGVFSREAHDLYGQSLVGKVLVCTTAKGGIATSWMLLDMVQRQKAPLAIVFQTTNPVMAQGAVLAGVALLHRLSPDPVETIHTGDWVRVDPPTGTITVLRRAGNDAPRAAAGAAARR
jgi:predicted aconitase with swiveling domain